MSVSGSDGTVSGGTVSDGAAAIGAAGGTTGVEDRPRRRWWKGVLAAVVVLGLLLGAGELALRLIVPGVIAGAVREKLELSADHPVEVSLGGSALLHALTGRVGEVSVVVDDAEFVENLRGELRLRADAVPFDFAHGEILGATAQLTIRRDDLPAAIGLLTGGLAESGEVRSGELVVGRTVEIFGVGVPVSVSLGLSVDDGDVLIDPKSITAAGFDLTAEQLSSLVNIAEQSVCVRDRLPAGLTLTGIELSSTGSVILSAGIDPGIASDPAEREPGTCP